MELNDSFLKEAYDLINKVENVLLYPVRAYVHKKVALKENHDEEIFKTTQNIIDRIMKMQKNDNFLSKLSVRIHKGKDVPTILPNGAMFASASYLNRFSDNEIAFIVGHEIAHLSLKHRNAETVVEVIGNHNLLDSYRRYCEHEADVLGMYFASQVGATIDDCFSAMKKLNKEKYNVIEKYAFWEDHPTVAERCLFVRNFYNPEGIANIREENFAEKITDLNVSNPNDVLRVKLDIINKLNSIRIDSKNYLGETLNQVNEQLKEEPLKFGLQCYLDTKKVLENLYENKKDNTLLYFQEKELDNVIKLAEEVLNLPEVKKFRGIGVLKGTVSLVIQRENKGKKWVR